MDKGNNNRIVVMSIAALTLVILLPGAASYSQDDYPTATDEQKKAALPSKLAGLVQKLTGAQDEKSLQEIIERAFSETCMYEEYDKFAADAMTAFAQGAPLKNGDYVDYAIARARFDQLSSLSKNNDIEAGRLYMSVNDMYFGEAVEYLDKAEASTASKDLPIDCSLLKFIIFKDKFQSEKSNDVFDKIASQIAKYSDDDKVNKGKLEDVFGRLKRLGFPKYAIKMKILYASKVDNVSAREVLEEIRSAAGRYFEQNDTKQASDLYEQYIESIPAYYTKEEVGAKIMEVAEKYFASGKYKDSKKYYNTYLEKYFDLKPADYCAYKLALSSYFMKDHIRTISQLTGFLEKYKSSVWFDKAFEMLAKVYYENLPRDKAIDSIKSIIDKYYRKDTGDYAQLLLAMLYYRAKNYESASDKLETIDPASSCYYASQAIIDNINEIKGEKAPPVFGTDATETYKLWDPYQGIDVNIYASSLMSGGQKIDITPSADGHAAEMAVTRGAKVQFTLQPLIDEDKFSEYTIDKDDESRLPKMIKEETERDLLLLHWAVDGGRFIDTKEIDMRDWQAPDEPGTYKLTVKVDDFGLARVPNKGSRKDRAKDLELNIIVE